MDNAVGAIEVFIYGNRLYACIAKYEKTTWWRLNDFTLGIA